VTIIFYSFIKNLVLCLSLPFNSLTKISFYIFFAKHTETPNNDKIYTAVVVCSKLFYFSYDIKNIATFISDFT